MWPLWADVHPALDREALVFVWNVIVATRIGARWQKGFRLGCQHGHDEIALE